MDRGLRFTRGHLLHLTNEQDRSCFEAVSEGSLVGNRTFHILRPDSFQVSRGNGHGQEIISRGHKVSGRIQFFFVWLICAAIDLHHDRYIDFSGHFSNHIIFCLIKLKEDMGAGLKPGCGGLEDRLGFFFFFLFFGFCATSKGRETEVCVFHSEINDVVQGCPDRKIRETEMLDDRERNILPHFSCGDSFFKDLFDSIRDNDWLRLVSLCFLIGSSSDKA